MTQTAVEWLFQKLWDEPKDKLTWYAIREKAIQMEKEQNNKTTNMDKNLTAVQWLVNEIFAGKTEAWQKEINHALDMEKNDLINSWDNGFANGYDLGKYNDDCNPEDAEQYYNETYKK